MAQRFQAPRSGIGNLDTDAAQQVLDLPRVAQVDVGAAGNMHQHSCIAARASVVRLAIAARARADETGDELLGAADIYREAVVHQLGAQQFGG